VKEKHNVDAYLLIGNNLMDIEDQITLSLNSPVELKAE